MDKRSKEKAAPEVQAQERPLEHFSTEALVKELRTRERVQAFETGLYRLYDVELKGKYAAREFPVEVPDYATVLVIADRL